MIAYNHILKKVSGINNVKSEDYKTEHFIFIQLSKIYENKETIKTSSKYIFFNQMILYNIFLSEEKREIIIDIFGKITKTYNAFSRLAYIYNQKKMEYHVKTDLCLNDLDEAHKHTMIICQDNKKYMFCLHDLIRIIDNSLSNSYQFFADPKEIKNPYNNVPFSKTHLYNIYFFINKYKCSELFEKYFLCNFELRPFLVKYEYLIVNRIINKFVNSFSKAQLLPYINEMLLDFNFESSFRKQLHIDRDFPNDLLIEIMYPFLKTYLISRYGLISGEKDFANITWLDKMTAFVEHNPQFGKKKIKIVNKFSFIESKVIQVVELSFNTDHKPYNEL